MRKMNKSIKCFIQSFVKSFRLREKTNVCYFDKRLYTEIEMTVKSNKRDCKSRIYLLYAQR